MSAAPTPAGPWPLATTRLLPRDRRAVAKAHGLSHGAELLLDLLLEADGPDPRNAGCRRGYCWWGLAALADELRCDIRTVTRYLRALLDAGLIERRQSGRGRTARTYLRYDRICGATPAPPTRPRRESPGKRGSLDRRGADIDRPNPKQEKKEKQRAQRRAAAPEGSPPARGSADAGYVPCPAAIRALLPGMDAPPESPEVRAARVDAEARERMIATNRERAAALGLR